MMHTEEQARKLWCPWARVFEGSGAGAAGINRSGPETGFYCIASKCAAWRWEWDDKKSGEPDGRHAEQGFCGLAGKQEP